MLVALRWIVESSPLYDSLRPLADSIAKVAQSRYPHPFKFFIVHESQPNAFATPGGNVYVVDSLFYFVKNTEQLAGTLCHEVSHTIHRDAVDDWTLSDSTVSTMRVSHGYPKSVL